MEVLRRVLLADVAGDKSTLRLCTLALDRLCTEGRVDRGRQAGKVRDLLHIVAREVMHVRNHRAEADSKTEDESLCLHIHCSRCCILVQSSAR